MNNAWNTPMKRYLLLFGTLGLVGCFLPIVRGTHLTLFDLRHFTWGAWLVVLAFLAPVVVACRGNTASTVLAGIAGFGYVGWRIGPHAARLVIHGGIGGKLIGVAVIGGVIATLGALLESRVERAAA
jgi:hypothetical protein